MADDLTPFRERASAHQAELNRDVEFFKPAELVKRWRMSATTLRGVPYDELPYMEYGHGLKLKRRSYSPEAVYAYESRRPKSAGHAA